MIEPIIKLLSPFFWGVHAKKFETPSLEGIKDLPGQAVSTTLEAVYHAHYQSLDSLSCPLSNAWARGSWDQRPLGLATYLDFAYLSAQVTLHTLLGGFIPARYFTYCHPPKMADYEFM